MTVNCEYASGAAAPQKALADLPWNDGGEKKRPQERGRVRSQREHVFPLASAFCKLLGQPASQDTQRDRQHLFGRPCRERERCGAIVVQGAAAGNPVLDSLKSPRQG